MSGSPNSKYWIVGYGRSGTKWLRRMILDALGFFDRPQAKTNSQHTGIVGVLHWHPEPLPGTVPAVYLHRDPRDVIVSMSRYWTELGGIDGVLNHQPAPAPPPLEAIDRMHRYWTKSAEARLQISYAQLIRDTDGTLWRVLKALEIQPPRGPALRELVEYHGFDNYMAKLKENERWRITKSLGPREGAWKTALNRSQGNRIHKELWYWLAKLGYERDEYWWRGLPARAVADPVI